MPCGPLVYRAPAIARVLRHVRGDVHPAQFSYEFSRVVILVSSQRHSLSRRKGLGHQQRSLSLRSSVRLRQKRRQQESVAVFHQYMPHITQLRLAPSRLRPQSGIGIGAGFMGLVLALFPFEVDVSSRSGGLARSVLGPETLVTGPGLNQRPIHREVFIGHKRPSSFQHPLEKRLGNLFLQQALSILAVHRVIPHRLVPLHSYKPAEQQVVLHLLDQHAFTAYRIEDLQQQGPQQPFGRYRWPPHVRVQPRKPRRHLLQNLIHHLADRSQRMVRRHSLLWRNVAEHSFLLTIVSAHSLASLTLLTSDEFLDLKLQKKGVFQQTANHRSTRFFSFWARWLESCSGCADAPL